jgi:hypothetical protein
MQVIYRYWKNSNTGHLLKSQKFRNTSIKGIAIYFYEYDGKLAGENLCPSGYVEISKKRWDILSRKLKIKESQND